MQATEWIYCILGLAVVALCIWQAKRWGEHGRFIVDVVAVVVVIAYTYYARQQAIETTRAVTASENAANAATVAANAAKSAADTAASQLAEMGKQTPELIRTATAAKIAADAAASAAKTAADQLKEMQSQTPELKIAAEAARSAADTALKALIDVQRPFLVPMVTKAEMPPIEIIFSLHDNQTRSATVEISLENLGTQAAQIETIVIHFWLNMNGAPFTVPEQSFNLLGAPRLPLPFLANQSCSYSDSLLLRVAKTSRAFSCSFSMSPTDFLDYTMNKSRPLLTAYVRYTDVLGTLREMGATWQYESGATDNSESGFVRYRGEAKNNYDRLVQK